MKQLIAHLAGDYIVQSDWMAAAKVYGSEHDQQSAAVIHASLYTACFVPLTRHPLRLAVIGVTHWALDRYRPFPVLIERKNRLLSPAAWPATPAAAVPLWLRIVVDNTAHLLINELALSLGRRGER